MVKNNLYNLLKNYSQDIPIDIIDSNKAPKKALQNPSTSTPGIKYATNINNKALITKINNPKVRILIGNVKNIKTGLITKFTSAIAMDAISAVKKLDIVIPGTTQPTNIIANDNANHFSMRIIFYTPFLSL